MRMYESVHLSKNVIKSISFIIGVRGLVPLVSRAEYNS